MDPMLGQYRAVAERLSFTDPRIRLVSGLSGELARPGELADAGYWVRHVREPVRFAAAVTALRGAGVATFLELGPDAALSALGVQITGDDLAVAWLPAMRADRDEEQSLVTAIAGLHVRGTAVDWEAFWSGTGARRTELPTYAFQREHYWMRPRPGTTTDVASAGLAAVGHPLLSAAAELPGSGAVLLTGRVSARSHPWLADHVVAGQALVPGTAFAELAVRAGDEAGCPVIEDLVIETPLVVREHAGIQLRVEVAAARDDGRRPVQIFAREEFAAADWVRHGSGLLAPGVAARPEGTADLAAWPPPGATAVDLTGVYARLAAGGLAYGPAFRGLRAVWRRGDGVVFAEVTLPPEMAEDAAGFGLHPALLDAVLHAADAGGLQPEEVMVPFEWAGVSLAAAGARSVRVQISPAANGDGLSLVLADPAGALVAVIRSLVCRPLPSGPGAAGPPAVPESLFQVDWVPVG
jgi:acyl transferase domain-containing protein